MVEQPIYLKILAWLSGLVPAIIGSVISLKFSVDDSFQKRFISFFSGIAIAHYIGRGIIEKAQIPPESFYSSSILFVIGIFGVVAVSEISKQLPEFIHELFTKLEDLIK